MDMHFTFGFVDNPAHSEMANGRCALARAMDDVPVVLNWVVPSTQLPHAAAMGDHSYDHLQFNVTRDQARMIDWQQETRVVEGGVMHASEGSECHHFSGAGRKGSLKENWHEYDKRGFVGTVNNPHHED
jgi:hypothetical protein